MKPCLATAALVLVLPACAVISTEVRDLRVVGIERVDPLAVSALRDGVRGALVRTPAAAITVSTRTDLLRLHLRHGVTVRADASLCRTSRLEPDRSVYVDPRVRDAAGPLDGRAVPASSLPADLPGDRAYLVLLLLVETDESVVEGRGDGKTPAAYDLLREPQDICLRLRGGSMLGGTWSSNTVRITADELRAALAGAAAAPGR